MRILLVEDDRTISHFLVNGLREEKHVVDVVEDGLVAQERAATDDYDLIVLDIMLPGMNGVDVCRKLRAEAIDTPILMLTAREEIENRIAGLDAGADDYLTKPFSFDELLARARAVTRRGRTRTLTSIVRHGPVEMDTKARIIRVNGTRLDLSLTEYRVLEQLVLHADTVVSREELAERVWGGDLDPGSNVVEVYIGYIRRKLQAVHPAPLVQTLRGFGYMLKV
ncbi:MAG: response regulator transcription factor [Acidobacteria bacterium]|nr:response regulator transcription factor [Acidobacteriota bacterium]